MGELSGGVHHFAFWKLLPAAKAAGPEELESAVADMQAIPGVTGIYFGPGVSTTALNSDDVDFAMIETFTSMAAVRNYLPHPVHRATIDISRSITKEGGAIYFMPLKIFASATVVTAPACMQVALIWLPETENQPEGESLIEAVKELRNIPGVGDVAFGPRAPTNWIGPDDTFDCAISLSFDSNVNAAASASHAAFKKLLSMMEQYGIRHQWYSFAPQYNNGTAIKA